MSQAYYLHMATRCKRALSDSCAVNIQTTWTNPTDQMKFFCHGFRYCQRLLKPLPRKRKSQTWYRQDGAAVVHGQCLLDEKINISAASINSDWVEQRKLLDKAWSEMPDTITWGNAGWRSLKAALSYPTSGSMLHGCPARLINSSH